MKKFLSIDFKHLRGGNFTYFSHFIRAADIGIGLFLASILCLLHSVVPFLFTQSASAIVMNIQKRHINFPSPHGAKENE